MASVIKMKPSYKVSVHAIEKHLNSDNTDASIFFNGRLMHDSIRKCLDKPDKPTIFIALGEAKSRRQDGSYGIHVNQKAPMGKTDREKVVARADKLLNKISETLIRDQKAEREIKKRKIDTERAERVVPVDFNDIQITERYDTARDESETGGRSRDTTALLTKQNLNKDDLLYGKEAFEYYKAIEKKKRIKELEKELAQKMADYDWKLEAIDELVNLAREYHNNPHGDQGLEWKNLKRKVLRSSERKKVSQTVIKHELSKLPKFKPIFTYTVIILQVLAFIILCIMGGISNIGLVPSLDMTTGIQTFLGKESIHRWVIPNIWLGPDQRFFIGVGAVYQPCMREDFSVLSQFIGRNFSTVEPLGCCEIAAKNVAGTLTEYECDQETYGVGFWRLYTPCGEREWADNSVAHLMKPCCLDLKGNCELRSRAYCEYVGGIFHDSGPEHCSQVNCLGDICKLGPLEPSPPRPWLPANPNQWWRLPLSIFYHEGIIHVALVAVIQWLIMRQIEQTAGWFRMFLIYFLSGIGGLLTSSLFDPNTPAMGGVSSMFGMVGVMLVELHQFWPSVEKPHLELAKITTLILVFLFLGTLPYLDNFGMITGLIIGMLCGIILLPYVTFRRWQVKIRLIAVAVAVPTLFLIMILLLVAFFKVQSFEGCDFCNYINCIPYVDLMCDSTLD